MTARETGGPAFPSKRMARIRMVADGVFDPDDPRNFAMAEAVHDGMTLRDYFAGQALAGLCAYGIPGEHHTPEATAEDAYAYADAMLAEREK